MDDFRRCEWCHRPFEYRLRSQSEQEMLKIRLKVSGEAALVERMICDLCYEKVITMTPNVHDPQVGESNSGPPNLLLRKFGQ